MTNPPGSSSGPRPVTPGGSVSDADIRANEWARQALSERLPRLRSLATAWGATITAVTAIFGLATIPDSDDLVSSLASPFSVLFGLAALGAVAAAAVSVVMASLAAQPSEVEVPPGIDDRKALYKKTVEKVATRLRTSRWSAGVAVLFLVLNFAIRWYAPRG